MPTDTKAVAARNKQSQASKRATVDLLKSKKRATTEFSIFLNEGEDAVELTLQFQAIGAKAYDKLVAKHPPKPDQRAEGASFDMDSFAPALISAVSKDPEISPEDARDLWTSEEWSRGDLMVLFRNAIELNNRGIDIPFSENG
jgi:hypothetical protein